MRADEAVDQALDTLAERLRIREAHAHDSHTDLAVVGLADTRVIDALGLYLVGLLAGVVHTNLRLSTALLEQTPEGHAQLGLDVEARLTPRADASSWVVDHFDANVRDPWIAEGVGHAVLAVRKRKDTACLSGPVAAMCVPHVKPSQQGLDLFALYDDQGMPAMALGEAKATLANGSGRLSEAIAFFRDVERGDRDVDIRMQVVVLHDALKPALQQALSGSFWKKRACYLPVIAHGDDVDMNLPRPALRAIARAATHKRVLHIRPDDYAGFFDGIADAMRAAVAKINP